MYSNDDYGLTLTYFTARSNLLFCGKKGKTMDFSESIIFCDIKMVHAVI